MRKRAQRFGVDLRWLLVLGLMLPKVHLWADIFVREDIELDPTPGKMTICHGNGCASLSHVGLTAEQWEEVRRLFHPLADSAQEERERLRSAIARMEKYVGEVTGTWRDKGGTFNGGEGQMDCIDESTNTTLYLKMFEKYGLMRHHRVADRQTRGWFVGGWPHTTAVIREERAPASRQGDGYWAVDSWFLDNGEPPFILPLEVWKSGWKPVR